MWGGEEAGQRRRGTSLACMGGGGGGGEGEGEGVRRGRGGRGGGRVVLGGGRERPSIERVSDRATLVLGDRPLPSCPRPREPEQASRPLAPRCPRWLSPRSSSARRRPVPTAGDAMSTPPPSPSPASPLDPRFPHALRPRSPLSFSGTDSLPPPLDSSPRRPSSLDSQRSAVRCGIQLTSSPRVCIEHETNLARLYSGRPNARLSSPLVPP